MVHCTIWEGIAYLNWRQCLYEVWVHFLYLGAFGDSVVICTFVDDSENVDNIVAFCFMFRQKCFVLNATLLRMDRR